MTRWSSPGEPHGGYRGRLRAAVSASAAPHGYTLALWTATAITSSGRGTPDAPDVLALLAGATFAFAGLAVVAYGGATMTSQRPGRDRPRVWAAFHLPTAACAALISLLLTRACAGPLLWCLVGAATTLVYLLGVSAQYHCFATREASE